MRLFLLRCLAAVCVVSSSSVLLAESDRTSQVKAERSGNHAHEEQWQTVWNSGHRVGYAQTSVSRKNVDGQTVVITDSLLSMTLKRFNQALQIRQSMHFEETEKGELIRFTSSMVNPPNSKSSMSGELDGATLTMISNVAGRETTKVIPEMQGALSSVWPERFIREGSLKLGEVKKFDVFEPQLGQKAIVSVEYVKDSKTSEGDLRREVIIRETLPGIPPIETHLRCNRDWTIENVSTPLLKIALRRATEAEALEPIGDIEFDFATDTMVRVTGLKNVERAKSIRYRITVEGVNPKEIFHEAAGQKVQAVDEHTIDLTVTKISLRDSQTVEGEVSGVEDAYLLPSLYLECDLPVIKFLVDKSGGRSGETADMAARMEKYVRNYVVDKNFSTAMATAAEVAKSKAGDCTEHAVLLAAMLRAAKIPSRVAIGFVYSPSHKAFVGHMWTEALLSEVWVPLDATMGKGGTGCGHITISTSSLADQGTTPAAEFLPIIHLLGRTQIEIVNVEQ